jgi:hypothetical protein
MGARAVVKAELAVADGEGVLREETLLGALAAGCDAALAEGVVEGRTFCDTAARALAQLARLGASTFGAGSSVSVVVAVEAGLLGTAAVFGAAAPLVAG